MGTITFVGLGSNLDGPVGQLRKAIGELALLGPVQCSPRYRSPPWGDVEQPDFVNAVAALQWQGQAQHLLDRLQAIEDRFGRVRTARRWGPRVLDLDLLAFGDQVINQSNLIVPHPQLATRAFVLVPWADIAPDFQVPGLATVSKLLAACEGPDELTLIESD